MPQQKQRAVNKLWADVEAKRKALAAQQQVRGRWQVLGMHCTMQHGGGSSVTFSVWLVVQQHPEMCFAGGA